MSTTWRVYGIVIEHGEVQSGPIKIDIGEDKNLYDLAEEIGNKQKPPIPAQHVLIWLVRAISILLVIPL
jgi:hypothetical protein